MPANADAVNGLSATQARARLKRFGPNTFRDTGGHSLPFEFFKRIIEEELVRSAAKAR